MSLNDVLYNIFGYSVSQLHKERTSQTNKHMDAKQIECVFAIGIPSKKNNLNYAPLFNDMSVNRVKLCVNPTSYEDGLLKTTKIMNELKSSLKAYWMLKIVGMGV